MCGAKGHVRFTPNSDRESGFPEKSCLLYPESGHVRRKRSYPLWANSGHRASRNFPDDWRLPGTIKNTLLAPVGADVEREFSIRRWKPIGFLVRAGGFVAGIERERAVSVAFEVLVLGAERVAFEVVRVKQVLVVVQRQ